MVERGHRICFNSLTSSLSTFHHLISISSPPSPSPSLFCFFMSDYIMATVQIPILHEYFKPEIPIYGRFLYEIRNYMKIRAVIPLWIFDAKQIFIAVKQLYMIHHLIKRAQRITTFFMRCHLFILASLSGYFIIFSCLQYGECLFFFFCSCS